MVVAEALDLEQLAFQRPKNQALCTPSYTLEQVSAIAAEHAVKPEFVISVIIGLYCHAYEVDGTVQTIEAYTQESEVCHYARIALTEQAEADVIVVADDLDISHSEALGSVLFVATQDESFMEQVREYLDEYANP